MFKSTPALNKYKQEWKDLLRLSTYIFHVRSLFTRLIDLSVRLLRLPIYYCTWELNVAKLITLLIRNVSLYFVKYSSY